MVDARTTSERRGEIWTELQLDQREEIGAATAAVTSDNPLLIHFIDRKTEGDDTPLRLDRGAPGAGEQSVLSPFTRGKDEPERGE
jgi:hypothetical protein